MLWLGANFSQYLYGGAIDYVLPIVSEVGWHCVW